MEQKNTAMAMMEPTAIENITRAEVDIAITTARRYPRSIKTFSQRATTMACIDADVAASCFYRLARQGKSIEGPSVRFAEIVAASYGNLRFASRVVEIGEKHVTAQGVAHDLENNVQVSVEAKRRITDKAGRRYNDDMIAMTANAACSIALRNAIFKAVPFSLAKGVYEQAKKTAIGDIKTLTERRTKMMAAFQSLGVMPQKIYDKVGIKGLEDIDLTLFEQLLGTYTAIRDGDTTVEEEFPDKKPETAANPPKTEVATAGAADVSVTAEQPSDSQEPALPLESAADGIAAAAKSGKGGKNGNS